MIRIVQFEGTLQQTGAHSASPLLRHIPISAISEEIPAYIYMLNEDRISWMNVEVALADSEPRFD